MSFCHSVKPAQKPRVAQGRAGLAKKTPRLLNSQLWIASTLDLPFFHRPCRQTWWKEFPGCMAIRSSGGSVSSSSTCYGLNHISQVIFLIIGTWNFQYCCTVNMKATWKAFIYQLAGRCLLDWQGLKRPIVIGCGHTQLHWSACRSTQCNWAVNLRHF